MLKLMCCLFAGLIAVTVVSTNVAQAQSAPLSNGGSENGSAMQYKVKVHLAAADREPMHRLLKSKVKYCYMQDMDPLDNSSMTLICGVPTPKTAFSP